jgi:L-lactate dehydrogenase complex protein LldG
MKASFIPSAARDEILRAVRAALPPAVSAPAARAKPEVPRYKSEELVTRFAQAATAAGAVVVHAKGDAAAHAQHAALDAHEILSLVPGVASTIATPLDPHALASLDLFVCSATVGVAESGAVWFSTADTINRAALFIAQRVVIVLDAKTIVADLHDAYERINPRACAFGTFVSGPSKTADIEQSLVIGAHGPKELTLIINAA